MKHSWRQNQSIFLLSYIQLIYANACTFMHWRRNQNLMYIFVCILYNPFFVLVQNREFLSLPLGDLNVIITPYTSLESIYIQSFENPQHHVITVRRDGTGKVATAEAHDSSCEQALNALSPEKMELSSFNSDEGYIYQGSPPPYVSSPGQQFGPGSECAVGFSRGTSNEGTAAFLCWKASRSENSLDQGYITSEYIATQECVVDDDVFNQA